jgi:hypothetical protein
MDSCALTLDSSHIDLTPTGFGREIGWHNFPRGEFALLGVMTEGYERIAGYSPATHPTGMSNLQTSYVALSHHY